MPIYVFQCGCGIRFEASAPMKDNQKPQPCPGCGEMAERWVPEDVHGAFDIPVSGPVPQNTGATSVDTDYDRVIGTSAEQGWEVQERRYKEKVEVMRTQGVEGSDLSRNPDGSYRVLTPEEKGVFQRGTSLNAEAMKIRKKILK
jgi:putative FmdB family regulatory protein